MRHVFCLLTLLLSCSLISSCASTRISNIPKSGGFVIEEDESRMWKRAEEFREAVAQSGFIYKDTALEAYVNEVLHKLVGAYEAANKVTLRAYILSDPFFNAFCLPDGTIYLHTSVLATAENEAQLATLLGHEAQHFLHRHSLREFRSLLNKSAFLSSMVVATGGVGVVLGQYCVVGSYYGYSRDLEREADDGAFAMVTELGYPYGEPKKLMEHFYEATKDDKNVSPYFYSTHPRTKERIGNYDEMINNYEQDLKGVSRVKTIDKDERYNTLVRQLMLDNADLEIKANRLKLARKHMERYDSLWPTDPRGYYMMGRSYLAENLKDDARKWFQKTLDIDPNFADAHRDLGLLYYKNKETDKARVEFETYIKIKPGAADAAYIKGYLNE